MGVNADLSKETKLIETGKSFLKAQVMNDGLDESSKKPDPKKLFGQLWWENELVICFAYTNVGKTLLAMQIADSLSKGINAFESSGDLPNPLPNETDAMKVLYIDAELTYKQIENRYKNHVSGKRYQFDKNIIRAEIDRDYLWKKGDNMEELVKDAIRLLINTHKPKAVIIDNLKMLKNGTEQSKEALPMMHELNNLKRKHNISIMALGHTPKIDLTSPIETKNLSGSSDIANACDGIFAIAKTKEDNDTRYIKELKQRNCQFSFGSSNVIVCTISQVDNFAGFTFNTLAKENDLLNPYDQDAVEEIEKIVFKAHKNKVPLRDLAKMTPWGKTKIAKIIEKKEEEEALSSQNTKDTKDKVDKTDKLDKTDKKDNNRVHNVRDVRGDHTVLDGQNIKAS